ncbi:MAG: DUF885 domain-containing protein [Lachnospiraceae bacterium]|nr:DUF885 domain-containing protein [Lachnospiraceae bacterium]
MPKNSICSDSTSAAASASSGHGRIESAFHFLLFLVFSVALTLAACHFFTHPPSFLLSEEQRFVRFTEDVFRSELSGNTLSLHYTISDPASFDLDDAAVTLGSASTEARQTSLATLENYLTALQKFDYEKLSRQRQLTYDVFLYYLETELSAADLLLYDEPIGPTLGVQAQLPVLMAEYAFRTKGDIEDYLSLLSQIPDYFDSLLAFEQDKADAGLFMNSNCVLDIISQCLDFASDGESHYLIELFDEKIDAVSNLTADEKIAYKARNRSILTGYVLPAYQALAEGLAALEGTGKNEMGLCYYPEGQEYYQYLVKITVGDSRSIEEIEEAIKAQIVADYAAIQKILENQTDKNSATSDNPSEADAVSGLSDSLTESNTDSSDDPAAILEELRQKITVDFPLLAAVDYEIRYVPDSLQEYLSPAFYLTPTIDDYTSNVIYINPASGYSDLELYTTLAHEGYPGHLYQSVYFASQSPDLLRCILDIGGYTEGWATYVEMYAYSLYDGDSEDAALNQLNRSFTLGLASLLDIGIHYHGYTPEETAAFLTQLGFSESTAESLYQAILESPANYLQYYVGYLNFLALRDTLETNVKNFSLKEFHQAVLKTGPVPFDILEEQCLAYFS